MEINQNGLMAPKSNTRKLSREGKSTPAKDQTELDLEKLVFGDEKGFRENVKHQAAVNSTSSDENEGNESLTRQEFEEDDVESGNEDIEAVEDSDVSSAMLHRRSKLICCSYFS